MKSIQSKIYALALTLSTFAGGAAFAQIWTPDAANSVMVTVKSYSGIECEGHRNELIQKLEKQGKVVIGYDSCSKGTNSNDWTGQVQYLKY